MQVQQTTLATRGSKLIAFLAVVMCLILATVIPATAAEEPTMAAEDEKAPKEAGPTSPEQLVTEAEVTLTSFGSDPELDWFRENVKNAYGLLIIPGYYAAGLVFSVGGGNGVLLKHDLNTQEWSQPAFYTASSVGAGLTAGVQASEVVVMLMTEKAVDAFYQTKFDLGAAGNVTLGRKGGGAAEDVTGDLVVYNRSKGLWVSINLATAAMAVHEDYNESYYGRPATPKQILNNEVSRRHSFELILAAKSVGMKVRRCTFCAP